ncbi:MAG: D-alanyl-D-alanine carboxypeptidase [Holosporaceae bacterium]|jgi:D-alanyl-D-alanine carboxypeptidase (penicillin-binding protein 5/6)|nr:D-alanyl-D-alanine carboxypeptidase [Holosporaceae bacterium]
MKKIAIALAVVALFINNCEAKKVKPKKSVALRELIEKKIKKNRPSKAEEFVSAEQAIVIDCDTGDCLYEKNADEQCAPSSLTKLMTLYILFEEIAAGRIKLDDEFPISEAAQKIKGSKSFFQAGTTAKIEDLIRSAIVHSGNDACVVIAEGISGDCETFAERMEAKVQEFGLKNTRFTNPTGMPDEEHYSCVRDIAMISRRIILDFPQFYHYFSEKTFTINSITQQNRNTLLGNALKIDGLKTGKTEAGGYGVSASAQNNGKRLIAVVNGCKSAKARAIDANKLLAAAFKGFVQIKIAEAGKPIAEAAVCMGEKNSVGLCSHEDITVSVFRKYRDRLKIEAKFKQPLEAPTILGAKYGTLVYKYGNFKSKTYDLFACEPVARVGILKRIQILLKRVISGDFSNLGGCPKDGETVVNIEIAQ